MTRKVLISPGFGAGWSTWAEDQFQEDCLFDPALIVAVEAGTPLGEWDEPGTPMHAFDQALRKKHGIESGEEVIYAGGAHGLEVVEVDGPFKVDEYDGSETIVTRNDDIWL